MTVEGPDLRRRRRAVRSPTAGSCRASPRRSRRSTRALRDYRFDLAATRAVRIHLVRVLRLVPGADQAGAAGRKQHRSPEARHAPHAGDVLEALLRALAPADAVHHRGDLAARAPAGRAAAGRRAIPRHGEAAGHAHARAFPAADDFAADAEAEVRGRAGSSNSSCGMRQIAQRDGPAALAADCRCCCRAPVRRRSTLLEKTFDLCCATRRPRVADTARRRRRSAAQPHRPGRQLTLLRARWRADRPAGGGRASAASCIAKNESDIGKLTRETRATRVSSRMRRPKWWPPTARASRELDRAERRA